LLNGNEDQLTEMLRNLSSDLASGAYRPLPYDTFPMRDIVAAFRFMAQAKHIGKVVIAHETSTTADEPARPEPFTGQGTYLVTGGLGALGLRLAAWMAEQGASHIVLMGRRGPDAAAEEQLAKIRAAGSEVLVRQADIANRDSVARLLADVRQTLPPLRGVFHAAGVLDDGMLVQQTADRFATVLRPKVEGSLILDELTREDQLEQFVLFSSASAILGSAAQGAYAAGNAFMDALAHARRAAGLPGLSVNWGGWGEIGMAANMDARQQRRMRDRGVMLINPQQGMDLLGLLLRRAPAQIAVLPTDWTRLLAQYGRDTVPVFLSEMQSAEHGATAASAGQASTAAETRRRLQEAAPTDRPALLFDLLTVQLCRVLGLPGADAVDATRSLSDHGLDSLLAVELRNGIESELGFAPPISHFISGPSVMGLAMELAEQFSQGGADASNGVVLQAADLPSLPDAAEIDELTDDEVNALLESMLAQTEAGR
jgi:myxalamid-type polyketide synthase MxaB